MSKAQGMHPHIKGPNFGYATVYITTELLILLVQNFVFYKDIQSEEPLPIAGTSLSLLLV